MAEENEINMEDDAIALEDSDDSFSSDVKFGALSDYVISRFKKSDDQNNVDLKWEKKPTILADGPLS